MKNCECKATDTFFIQKTVFFSFFNSKLRLLNEILPFINIFYGTASMF